MRKYAAKSTQNYFGLSGFVDPFFAVHWHIHHIHDVHIQESGRTIATEKLNLINSTWKIMPFLSCPKTAKEKSKFSSIVMDAETFQPRSTPNKKFGI